VRKKERERMRKRESERVKSLDRANVESLKLRMFVFESLYRCACPVAYVCV